MSTYTKYTKVGAALILVMGLLVSTSSNAWWRGGGGWHGGGWNNGWHGGGWNNGWRGGGYGYRGWGWGGVGYGGPVIVGGYIPVAQCTVVRQCYRNGTCVARRICN